MSFTVRYSAAAREDLKRLYGDLLERDASSPIQALETAQPAIDAIIDATETLQRSPFIYRKAGASPFLRELLIPFRSRGYVALFEIEDAATVTILAVRHQAEDDYH